MLKVVVLPYRDRTDLYELMAHRPIVVQIENHNELP